MKRTKCEKMDDSQMMERILSGTHSCGFWEGGGEGRTIMYPPTMEEHCSGCIYRIIEYEVKIS